LYAFITIIGQKNDLLTKNALNSEEVCKLFPDSVCDIQRDSSYIYSFKHMVKIPLDPQRKCPIGPRNHSPINIVKSFDVSSPLLYKALISGEIITECTIKWYRFCKEGQPHHYFTHLLEDAIISKISYDMTNIHKLGVIEEKHFETIEITYRKLSLIHETAMIVVEDDKFSAFEET